MTARALGLVAVVCALHFGAASPSYASEDDPDYTAMVDGDGKDFAYLVCSDCHAMQHVLQKPYSRRGWRDAIKRMTDDFGMAELTPDEATLILDYLTRHYGTGSGR